MTMNLMYVGVYQAPQYSCMYVHTELWSADGLSEDKKEGSGMEEEQRVKDSLVSIWASVHVACV